MSNKKKQKKLNEIFLDTYIGMDKVCCRKFGVAIGGVTEYVNRLINARTAPGRDEALTRLVKYRSTRNKIAHERGALENINDISKSDIKWIERFTKSVERKRDPFFSYLKKARRKVRGKKALRVSIIVAAVLAVAAVALFFILK